jgi:hypothetical protein
LNTVVNLLTVLMIVTCFTGYIDLFEVSEVQGGAGGSEKPGSKTPGNTAAGGSFLGAQQPYSRLGWNADMNGATKEKQEQVILMCN